MQKPETVWRNKVVIPFLKKLPNTVVFSIQQMAIRGTPDLLCCINGQFVGIELKTDIGCLSPLQYYFLDEIRKAQGYGFCASPSTWEALSQRLERIARGDEG